MFSQRIFAWHDNREQAKCSSNHTKINLDRDNDYVPWHEITCSLDTSWKHEDKWEAKGETFTLRMAYVNVEDTR